jgi:hypothetical protein
LGGDVAGHWTRCKFGSPGSSRPPRANQGLQPAGCETSDTTCQHRPALRLSASLFRASFSANRGTFACTSSFRRAGLQRDAAGKGQVKYTAGRCFFDCFSLLRRAKPVFRKERPVPCTLFGTGCPICTGGTGSAPFFSFHFSAEWVLLRNLAGAIDCSAHTIQWSHVESCPSCF